jgi:hypothetical protein
MGGWGPQTCLSFSGVAMRTPKRRRNCMSAREKRRIAKFDETVKVNKRRRHVMTKSRLRKRLMEDLKSDI